MHEFPRLTGPSTAIELNFVERVHTSTELMRLAIQTHLGGLSLAETRRMLQSFGVERARSTIHNWVQKCDLEPAGGCQPDQVALDETVVKVNGERFWLFGAVDPETGRILHVRMFPNRTIVTTKLFLHELGDKHDIEDT
ncbi:MAG: IS6 family transposase, partial [Natronomonas sp.]